MSENESLSDSDAIINLNENQNRVEIKRPFYYKSLKNYIISMMKIKWRTRACKFTYFSSFFMTILGASLFASIQSLPEKNPVPYLVSSSILSKNIQLNTLYFGPKSKEVNEFVSTITSSRKYNITLYNDFKEMSNDIYHETEQIIYGFYIEDNYSNLTVISNDITNQFTFNYHSIETLLLNKFYPNLSITFLRRQFAQPPHVVNIETTSSAFYLIFPFFYWMLISLNIDVNFNVKRNTFSILLNGLPELILYAGRAISYFAEMFPIGIFFVVIMNQFIILDDKKIDMLFFTEFLTLFILSYSLRFVIYGTFIHSEKTMSFWVTILQIITFVELSALDSFPNYSTFFKLSLLLLIPQYPLFVVYYIFLIEENKEIEWDTKPLADFYSFKELFLFQLLNVIVNVVLCFFFVLMNKQPFGLPIIGWRNIFKAKYWKRCFKQIRSLSFDHQYLIQLNNVKFTYKGTENTLALNGINLSIKPNEVVVFVGPNGSGKSTLFDILTGAIEQDEGEIKICGFDLRDIYFEYHSQLGAVFQSNTLYDKLSAREHFVLYAFRIGQNEVVNSEIERLSGLLQIDHVLDSFAEDLSGGEKRKLCLALALLQNPKFLIIDEPTAGVDAFCRRQIWKVVGDLSSSTTTLVSTHSLEESEYISTRFAVLRRGQIAFLGTGAEIRLKFNSGYKISFIQSNSSASSLDINHICEEIQKVIPEASVDVDKKNTLCIPSDLRVAEALEIIEKNKTEFNIDKYTIQIDNLEESLVKLIEEEEGEIHVD